MAHLEEDVSELALVIVPTFNERESIGEVVRRLFDASPDGVHLLVVDDASADGTGELVADLAAGSERIHLLRRASKQGLGTAYVAGFRWGIERGYGALVEMDADLSHDPARVPALLEKLDTAEVVIGSRYVPGGRIENWGALRRLLSTLGNVYARAWLGYGVKDSTSGFRAYRTSFIAGLDLDRLRSEGYAFQIELTRLAHLSGARIAELPITFVERAHGKSKMSRRIVLEALLAVTRWGIGDRFRRRRAPTGG